MASRRKRYIVRYEVIVERYSSRGKKENLEYIDNWVKQLSENINEANGNTYLSFQEFPYVLPVIEDMEDI